MAKYFDLFPKISFDIEGKQYRNYKNVTNVMFRLRVVREALSNVTAYYRYIISDDETPEILAEKIYGDSEAHWIILLANDIVDPQFDWPLNTDQFTKYIIGKYGSIENALTTFHHFEKVIEREDEFSGVVTQTAFVINEEEYAEAELDVPYDTYESLPETQELVTINMGNGKTVFQTTYRRAVTNFDYESEQNEAKREIKVIKPEYYNQIIREFNALTNFAATPYLRKLI